MMFRLCKDRYSPEKQAPWHYILIPLFLLLILCSCKKNSDEIPDVYVDIYISVTDPQFNDLNAVGGWVYVTGGSKGIIVYRRGAEEFMAYERHCPYQPSNTCSRVSVDSNNVMTVDTCCGSKFMLYDGAIVNGPAISPMKRYNTSFNGNVVRVMN